MYAAWGKFIINELAPRATRKGVRVDEFIPALVAFILLDLERQGLTYRAQTRRVLDFFVGGVDFDKELVSILNIVLRILQTDEIKRYENYNFLSK